MGIKFPTPWKTLIIKFPPPRDGKGVKCPEYALGAGGGGMLKLRFDRYIRKASVDMPKPRFASSISQSANDFFSSFFILKKRAWGMDLNATVKGHSPI